MSGLEDIVETLHKWSQYIMMQIRQLWDGVKVNIKTKSFNAITSRSKWKVKYQYKGKNHVGYVGFPIRVKIVNFDY